MAAAALFWLSWLLMPGVGVTDSERILELVGSRRPAVLGSVVAQLISAVLYVPALCGVVADSTLGARTGVRWGAGLLLVGAMGSAADAVFHLLAYAMTAPDLDPATLVRVMDFMQGSGLFLIAPLIAAFFLGGAGLSVALGRAALVSRWNGWIHALALGVATLGGTFAAAGLVPSRLVGLATLGLVSVAQAWVGVALWKLGASEPR